MHVAVISQRLAMNHYCPYYIYLALKLDSVSEAGNSEIFSSRF